MGGQGMTQLLPPSQFLQSCRAGGDPMQEKDWVSQNTPLSPSVFASHLVFPLSLHPFRKESSGTQRLSLVLLHKSPDQLLGLNRV